MNNVARIFRNFRFLLFADDLKIYRQVTVIEGCNLLQPDLDAFCGRCKVNHLILNPEKCKIMKFSYKVHEIDSSYTMNSILLVTCQSVEDLGITADKKLTFVRYIDTVISGWNQMIELLRKNSKCTNSQLITALYIDTAQWYSHLSTIFMLKGGSFNAGC